MNKVVLLFFFCISLALAESFRYDLPPTLEDNYQIQQLIVGIREMKAEDSLNLYSSGFGGSVMVELKLGNAIEDTKGQVKLIYDGPAYSAHAMLACFAKDIEMRDGSFLMFHNYRISTQLESGEKVEKQLKALNSLTREVFEKKCQSKGLLTSEEIDAIFQGEEIYLTSDQVKERLKK